MVHRLKILIKINDIIAKRCSTKAFNAIKEDDIINNKNTQNIINIYYLKDVTFINDEAYYSIEYDINDEDIICLNHNLSSLSIKCDDKKYDVTKILVNDRLALDNTTTKKIVKNTTLVGLPDITQNPLIISKRLFNIIKEYKGYVKIKSKQLNDDFNFEDELTLNIKYSKEKDNDIIFSLLDAPKFGNYFDIINEKITYNNHPKKQKFNDDNKWKKEGRTELKVSKLISYLVNNFDLRNTNNNKILTKENSGILIKDIKKIKTRFIELLSAKLKESNKNKIEVSDDPNLIYKLQLSTLSLGSLATSCMRIDSPYNCKNYADFYNELEIKILFIKDDNGNLLARALLWHDVKIKGIENKVTFMDRVYSSESIIQSFIEYAKDHKYAYKVSQSSGETEIAFYNEETDSYEITSRELTFTTDVEYLDENEGYPYMDTLFCTENFKTFSSKNNYTYCIQYTEGNQDESETYSCESCGHEVYNEEELMYSNNDSCYYCRSCCTYVYSEDDYYLNDEIVYSDYLGENILYEDSIHIDNVGYMPENHDEVCLRKDGEYDLRDNLEYCDYCGEYQTKNKTIYGEGGNYCSQECFEECEEIESVEEDK